jgi:PAS domain S-box-containing protein
MHHIPRTSLRDNAEEQLTRTHKRSPDLTGQSAEALIHELQVCQIELETQAEELRRVQLALEESRDKFLDLYDFAPTGYLTLTDKVLIAEVNLAGATLLGVERSKLVNTRFRKFIAPEFFEQWDQYFVNLLRQEEKQTCTLTLKRSDGSTVPARMEGIRLSGRDEAITIRITISDISDIWQVPAPFFLTTREARQIGKRGYFFYWFTQRRSMTSPCFINISHPRQ